MRAIRCPNCKEDLRQYLTYVEDSTTNYIDFVYDDNDGWLVDDEQNGENAAETYYICRACGKELPDKMQTRFQGEIPGFVSSSKKREVMRNAKT